MDNNNTLAVISGEYIVIPPDPNSYYITNTPGRTISYNNERLEEIPNKGIQTIVTYRGKPVPLFEGSAREDTITTLNNKFEYTKYKNKYRINTVQLPEVKKVEMYNDKVIKMTFADGTFTKAVRTNDPDEQLVAGMAICYLKKMLDKDSKYSTNIFNKVISKIMKIFKRKDKDKKNGK